jgi:hypothetical protein
VAASSASPAPGASASSGGAPAGQGSSSAAGTPLSSAAGRASTTSPPPAPLSAAFAAAVEEDNALLDALPGAGDQVLRKVRFVYRDADGSQGVGLARRVTIFPARAGKRVGAAPIARAAHHVVTEVQTLY